MDMVKARVLRGMFHPKRHLDIGCGKGFLVREMLKEGVDSHGLDNAAVARYEGLKDEPLNFHQVDLTDGLIPFEDGSFDLITCYTVIDYLYNFRHALNEMSRVAKPSSTLVMSFSVKRTGETHRYNIYPEWFWASEHGELNRISFDVLWRRTREYRKFVRAPRWSNIKVLVAQRQ